VARLSGKPILYDFTADWCPPCRLMKREVFGNADEARKISMLFVPIRVLDRAREDGQNSPEVAALQMRYHITGFPTLIVVSPGNQPQTLDGYPGSAQTMAWLEGAAGRARFPRTPGPASMPGSTSAPGASDTIGR
jgi:protein disulfide-isomerase